jgi:hypothetical protein
LPPQALLEHQRRRPAQGCQQPRHPGTHRRYAGRKAIVDEISARTAAAEVTAD